MRDSRVFLGILFFFVLGPVVQSIVSLMSSLRVISLTVLADSIYSILIFFAEKMWVAFALQKLLTFFQQKISAYLRITDVNFNESLLATLLVLNNWALIDRPYLNRNHLSGLFLYIVLQHLPLIKFRAKNWSDLCKFTTKSIVCIFYEKR